MFRNSHSLFLVALSLLIPAGSLVISGCSKGEAPPEPTADAGGGNKMGGPGGGNKMGGDRFKPVAADAKAADIFQQKCAGCHGQNGEGKRGPNLTKVSGDPDAELIKTIHDGKGRMPSFSSQMTDAQIGELVTYVKGLGAPK